MLIVFSHICDAYLYSAISFVYLLLQDVTSNGCPNGPECEEQPQPPSNPDGAEDPDQPLF